jgi:hypothetical protein
MTTHARWYLVLSIVASFGLVAASCGDDEPDATATFTTPASGTSIAGGVAFTLAADGVTIEPAGDVHEAAGHFHVIADAGCVKTGEVIPKDADHVHLGSGAAGGTIYLTPGTHELCVQVGDGVHTATDATSTVSVDVGITDREGWCTVVAQVDEMLNGESDESDFAAEKALFVNIGRQVSQLRAGMEQVDDDARDNVTAAIDFVQSFVDAIADAENQAEAEANAGPIWELEEDPTAAAQPWILDACGVDISDENG